MNPDGPDEKYTITNIKVRVDGTDKPVRILYANCPCCHTKFPWGLKQEIKETKKDAS